jgi:predicted DNA-binding transcriptional regulator YafY
MLRLLSLLQTHRYWPGTMLAERLEVSERTLRRDIDRLRELGYHVDASRGVAGGYQLRFGSAMPPLLLEDEEAVAIAVGLRAAAAGSVQGLEETSLQALTKVIQVLPPRLRGRVGALREATVPALTGNGPKVDAVALTTLAQACRDEERLRFGYTAKTGEQSNRWVEPYRLVPLGRNWYLVAYDLDRGDWRTFRVDRLTKPETTGARFRQRELPAADAAEFVRQQLSSIPVRHHVVITIKLSAAEVEKATTYAGGTVEPIDESSCRLSMALDDFDWVVLILAALGAEFQVERPDEFRDFLRGTAELLLRGAS